MRALLTTLCLSLLAFTARAEIVDVGNAELSRLMAAGVPVIDIRTAPEWKETGIVPGSHLLTFFDEKGRADPAAWLSQANRIAKPGQPVVLICRSGNRTKEVSRLLSEKAGYAKVYNVKDGIRAWAREGRPMISAASAMAACKTAKTC
jgi:rhodanese-related sulfurtransferase